MTLPSNPSLIDTSIQAAITGDQLIYVADSSNIEARMLAWEAGQEDLLEVFRSGGDVYAYTAQDIYNRPIDKKKDPHERFIGKVTCLGADTRVITRRGIKRLVDVTTADQLWDGSQWVNHDGLTYKGEKPTISICGVDMTPDHKTLCGTTWHEAETLARDASTLSRALETGAGALQSLATWLGNADSVTSKPESGNSKPESGSSKSRMPVYDLLNAGPNHRFTILTDAGPMIVHNCLGLGYGMGWAKFQNTLAAGALGGPPVFMSEAEVRHIVNTFRTKRYRISAYWKGADQAIIDMYMGNVRQWGPLTIHRNCLVMPNGMALQYPRLRPAEDDEFGGWEYWNGQFFTKIYGGKLCLAKGTKVLTREGWTNIEDVTPNTEVWDGIEWVKCDGSVYNGDKLVIELAGVTMTPDHEVLTGEGWKTASQSQGHNRAESRLPDGDGVRWERWEEIPVVGDMRLRQHQDAGSNRADQDAEARDFGLLRLQEVGEHLAQPNHARDVEASGLCRVALDDRPLHPADAPSLGQLRGAGDQGLPALEGVIRGVLGGHGADLSTGPDTGPHGQQPALHAGELPLGDAQHPGQQPQGQRADQRQNGQADVDGVRDRAVDPVVSAESWLALGQAATPDQAVQPVYDLINCGPRNRFVVRDGNGNPLIVHNCENITQALARIVLFDQMLAVDELFRSYGPQYGVALNVHDEVIAVGPSFGARFLGLDEKGKEVWDRTDGADELFHKMLTIMRTPPAWCPDLPLDGEGGFSFEYSK